MANCKRCSKKLTKAQTEGVFDINDVIIGPYCNECWEVIKTCSVCGEARYHEENINYYGDGMFLCDECKVDHLGVCDGCGEDRILKVSMGGFKMCTECASHMFQCTECAKPVLHEMAWLPSMDGQQANLLRMSYPGVYKKHSDKLCMNCFEAVKHKFKFVETFICKRCGNCHNKNFAQDEEGNRVTDYCASCWTSYMFHCHACNTVSVRDGNELVVDSRNKKFMCVKCAIHHYTCLNCGQFRTKKDHPMYLDGNGNTICNECIELPQCSKCGRFKPTKKMHKDGQVCKSCHGHLNGCEGCGERTIETVSMHETKGYFCRKCTTQKGYGYIWNYSWKPYPIVKGNPDTLIVGIENEVSCRPKFKPIKVLGLVLKHYDEDFVYAKADSSVFNGFELVTHPMTYDYFKSVDWSFMFPKGKIMSAVEVQKQNFKDPESGKIQKYTGMHVHLSKDYFTTFHLYKFINFLYSNHKYSEKIGERKSNKYCHNFPNYTEVKQSSKSKRTTQRSFIYMPNSTRTVELRFFAGCHTEAMFVKNVEFIQALYEYTRDAGKGDAGDIVKFEEYVLEEKVRFPTLVAFLKLS